MGMIVRSGKGCGGRIRRAKSSKDQNGIRFHVHFWFLKAFDEHYGYNADERYWGREKDQRNQQQRRNRMTFVVANYDFEKMAEAIF
jgi:hypothetical protein